MFEFGKYGIYIWACYGISAAVLGALVVYTFAARPKDAIKPDENLQADENPPR